MRTSWSWASMRCKTCPVALRRVGASPTPPASLATRCRSAAASSTEPMQEGAARATLTLAAAKAALQKWQGHMRRGAQLQNETEYAAALALVPQLPQPAVYQARTLRALADLYHATGRLDEAASVFE